MAGNRITGGRTAFSVVGTTRWLVAPEPRDCSFRGASTGAQVPSQEFGVMLSVFHPVPRPKKQALTERDAIDIWIARWLRVRRKDLLARYDCDPRRLYEIWQGER